VCGVDLDGSNTHPLSDEIGYCVECMEQRMASEWLALFCEAVAIVAEQRVAEKKAKRAAKKQANLRVLGRAQFKATGAVLIGIEDRNGKRPERFHLTLINGRVMSCLNAETGNSCDGRKWSGHCCHETRAMQYEEMHADASFNRSVALPVAVRFRGGDGSTAILDLGEHREVVCTSDLPGLFPKGYRLVECDDPERDAWDERLQGLEDRTNGRVIDAAWLARVRTCLPTERQSDIVTDDDLAAHVEDSIRSGEFADPTSCRYCGALCRGGVCMDCLSVAA
jgi:hypothetical protein